MKSISRELKNINYEEIKHIMKKTFITKEKIEEIAAKIPHRFMYMMRPESERMLKM